MKTASKKNASQASQTTSKKAAKKAVRKVIGDKPRTKTIFDLVRKKKTDLEKPVVARANKKLAVAAVTGGLGSPAWEEYMRQFVSNNDPEQLSRLLAKDDTANDPEMIERRAYLVSNGVCGQGTKGLFDNDVQSIDAGLEANC